MWVSSGSGVGRPDDSIDGMGTYTQLAQFAGALEPVCAS